MSKELMEYFNTQPRLGTLSTASKEGKVDVAYLGSAQMTDEKQLSLGWVTTDPSQIFERTPMPFL